MGDLLQGASVESSMQNPSIERPEVPYLCGQMSAKIDNLEKAMKLLSKKSTSQGKALGRVERKVFNGFGDKINHMEKMIEQHRIDNENAHIEFKKSLGLFARFGVTALILIFVALLSILGSIWLQDRVPIGRVREAQINAPIDPVIETQ